MSTLLSSDDIPSSLILEPIYRDSSGSSGFFRIRTDILELSVIPVESEFEPLQMLCLDPILRIRFCLDFHGKAGPAWSRCMGYIPYSESDSVKKMDQEPLVVKLIYRMTT